MNSLQIHIGCYLFCYFKKPFFRSAFFLRTEMKTTAIKCPQFPFFSLSKRYIVGGIHLMCLQKYEICTFNFNIVTRNFTIQRKVLEERVIDLLTKADL